MSSGNPTKFFYFFSFVMFVEKLLNKIKIGIGLQNKKIGFGIKPESY